MTTISTRVEQFRWYHKRYGILRLASLVLRKVADHWFFRSEYVFAIDLGKELPVGLRDLRPIVAESFLSMESIPAETLDQVCMRKGRAVALPFLQGYFPRGGRLWLGKDQEKVVGLQWTFQGGFSGFYSLPIPPTDVTLVAVETFREFRGHQYWQRFLVSILGQLRTEQITRLYFKVHNRNHPMLRAVRKAGFTPLGRVTTFNFPGHYLTIWRKRFLPSEWRGDVKS